MRIVSQSDYDTKYKKDYTKYVTPKIVSGHILKTYAKEYKGFNWTLALLKLFAEVIPSFGLALLHKSVKEDWEAVFKGRKIVAIDNRLPSFKAMKDGVKLNANQLNQYSSSELKKAADKGDSVAMVELGYRYQVGWGKELKKDLKEAIKLYQQAAEKGNSAAHFHLGAIYLRGEGVEKNEELSKKHFAQSIQLAKVSRIENQGIRAAVEDFYEKKGNSDAPLDFLKAAAEGGNAEAATWVGRIYQFDVRVKNDAEAIRWYNIAADKNNKEALLQLEQSYRYGWGVEKNEAKANEFAAKASKL